MDSTISAPGLSRAASQADVAAQNWKLLKFFNFYRVAIALAAAAIALLVGKFTPFGETHPGLFLSTSLVYALIALIAVAAIHWRTPDFDSQAALLSFTDAGRRWAIENGLA